MDLRNIDTFYFRFWDGYVNPEIQRKALAIIRSLGGKKLIRSYKIPFAGTAYASDHVGRKRFEATILDLFKLGDLYWAEIPQA